MTLSETQDELVSMIIMTGGKSPFAFYQLANTGIHHQSENLSIVNRKLKPHHMRLYRKAHGLTLRYI